MSSPSTKFILQPTTIDPLDLEYLQDNHKEESYQPFHITKLQCYHPLHSKLLGSVSENIAFNHPNHFLNEKTCKNIVSNEPIEKEVFIKFSPLLDPNRYMIGKYDVQDERLRTLPQINNSELSHPKLIDPNNASYVDSFFSFLTSILLNHHGFNHGLDYYGSFLGIQDKFKVNIADDLDYLNSSTFFMENMGKLFDVNNTPQQELLNFGSRTNKQKIRISSTTHNLSVENLDIDIDIDLDVEDITETLDEELVYEQKRELSSTSSSGSSSNNSETNYSTDEDVEEDEDEDEEDEDEEEDDDEDEDDDEEDEDNDDEEEVLAYIHNFPTQMICLEKCHGTFDELFVKHAITEETGASALMQIIMILLTYQQTFHFTHNDLHTNNIMYINTDIENLYYKVDGEYYKVPTHGRIFKIIDFGRGIYRFNGNAFCSDSFATGGDAATQYNFEPYMNSNKPRLDPNYSFDLCRLGTSIYDFVIDDDEDENLDEFQKTIRRWCHDDNGKNVLYKKSGEERYPNFKLYKMITRTVHQHTPKEQLKHDFFKQFKVSNKKKKALLERKDVMNIDSMPCYV